MVRQDHAGPLTGTYLSVALMSLTLQRNLNISITNIREWWKHRDTTGGWMPVLKQMIHKHVRQTWLYTLYTKQSLSSKVRVWAFLVYHHPEELEILLKWICLSRSMIVVWSKRKCLACILICTIQQKSQVVWDLVAMTKLCSKKDISKYGWTRRDLWAGKSSSVMLASIKTKSGRTHTPWLILDSLLLDCHLNIGSYLKKIWWKNTMQHLKSKTGILKDCLD